VGNFALTGADPHPNAALAFCFGWKVAVASPIPLWYFWHAAVILCGNKLWKSDRRLLPNPARPIHCRMNALRSC
jgi:hypothetical protein